MRARLWTAFGLVCVALGLAGAVLPLMPTTVFMLLAAYAFARGSPRLRAWIVDHPRFGPPVRRWEESGAISRRHKIYAAAAMAASLAIGLAANLPRTALIIQAICLAGAATFVLTRPDS